jgi:hypothetical protein
MKRFLSYLLLVTSVPLALGDLEGRQPKSESAGIETVQLPADYTIDLQLASLTRSTFLGGSRPIVGTALNAVGAEVFNNLIGNTTISGLGLPYQWNLTLVGNDDINAASSAGGQVYVKAGLANLMGSNQGLWAAVLSHEVAHTALRHQVRVYLQRLYVAQQIQYFRWQIANGNEAANWALLGFAIAAPIALKKVEREQEHQADIQGMMLMARAGYHPDHVFALHHLLEMRTGDQSKFVAFFSDHPRWATRDQRSDRAYADALAEFNTLWPDPDSSPGGAPPLVAFLGEPRPAENKRARTLDISVPLYCRNNTGDVRVVVSFAHKNQGVPSRHPSYSSRSGNLEARERIPCPNKEDATPAEIRIPAAALLGRDRKLKAEIFVLGPDGALIERSKIFNVHFPKP